MFLVAMGEKINSDEKFFGIRDKVNRSLAANRQLMRLLFKEVELKFNAQKGNVDFTAEIDVERLVAFFESVGRGVLFHENGIRWVGDSHAIPHFLATEESPKELRDLSEGLWKFIGESESKGVDTSVFHYEVSDLSENGKQEFLIDMAFYRQFEVSVIFRNA